MRRIGCQRTSVMPSWAPATVEAGAGLIGAAEAGVVRVAAPKAASKAAVIIDVRKGRFLSCGHWERWRLAKAQPPIDGSGGWITKGSAANVARAFGAIAHCKNLR